MRELTFTIGAEYDGLSAQAFLMRHKGFSRRLITALKQNWGDITLGGIPIRTVKPLHEGDVLQICLREGETLAGNAALSAEILYEDTDLVVYNKPVGMPVHPSHRHTHDTLGNLFAAQCGGRGEAITFRPINRLDKDTSGLCAVAKNTLAAIALQRSIDKTYFAILCGELPGECSCIDAPIARAQESIILRRVHESGQRAVTNYTVLGRGGGYTLVRVKLETGRTHQIRVHFAHEGYPLAGDDLYGGSQRDIREQALHCGELIFPHPMTQEQLHLYAPLRPDMQELLDKVGIPCQNGTILNREMNAMNNQELKKIASFEMNHLTLKPGMYTSRVDGDIVTYDIRMCRPNGGVYLSNASMHTIEHLFATYARSSELGSKIIYVGPMGCRTGFYLLVRDMAPQDAISLVQGAYSFIAAYEGEIPGAKEVECGNYREHDLAAAKRDVLPMTEILSNYTPEMLAYTWHNN